jgi:hypothetical protein
MARPSNPENRYSFTCKVTGETVKTNPKQFAALANRYGITNEELDISYVSRAGRRKIADEKLSPESAAEKYGLHLNIAKFLKCTVKEKAVKAKQEKEQTETSVAEQGVIQPEDNLIDVNETISIKVSEDGVQVEKSDTSFSVSIPSEVEEENYTPA